MSEGRRFQCRLHSGSAHQPPPLWCSPASVCSRWQTEHSTHLKPMLERQCSQLTEASYPTDTFFQNYLSIKMEPTSCFMWMGLHSVYALKKIFQLIFWFCSTGTRTQGFAHLGQVSALPLSWATAPFFISWDRVSVAHVGFRLSSLRFRGVYYCLWLAHFPPWAPRHWTQWVHHAWKVNTTNCTMSPPLLSFIHSLHTYTYL